MQKKHELTVSEAARLGGLKVSQDREYMAKIGRKGAKRSLEVRRKKMSTATAM